MNRKIDTGGSKALNRLSIYSRKAGECWRGAEIKQRTCMHAYKHNKWAQETGGVMRACDRGRRGWERSMGGGRRRYMHYYM